MLALCVACSVEPCWFPHLHPLLFNETAVDALDLLEEDAGRRAKGVRDTECGYDFTGRRHVVGWYNVLLGVTGLAMCTQLIQLLVISTRLAGLTYMVGKLLSEVSSNIVIVVIVILGFAFFLSALQEPHFESFGDSMLVLTKFIVGLEPPEFDDMSPVGLAVLITFIVITYIGLLSILIAQLTLVYEHLSEQNVGYAQMNRAFVCIEVESCLPLSIRRRIFRRFGFDLPVEFDTGDEGPTGGIQVLEQASVQAHPKYIPDRIMRATGPSSELEPWPRAAD